MERGGGTTRPSGVGLRGRGEQQPSAVGRGRATARVGRWCQFCLSLSAWLQSEGGRHNGVIGTQPPKIAEVGLDTLSHHACRAPFFSSRRCSRDSVLLSARAAACHPADRPAIFLPVLILPRRQAVADCNSNSNLILRPALVTIHLFLASIWTRASAAAHDDFRLRSLLVQRTSTTWHLLKAAAMASLVCCATFRRRMLPPRHTMAPH